MSAPAVFASAGDLRGAVGRLLGPTDWLVVEQSRIDKFADATGDHQWIHVDPVRAASGPFQGTIAHGYLTLALVNLFLPQLIAVPGASMGINYGSERVRFPSAVRSGSRIRAAAEIARVEDVRDAVQVMIRVTVEIEGSNKPACVAETLSRYYFPTHPFPPTEQIRRTPHA
jgi:acyl dehydratase